MFAKIEDVESVGSLWFAARSLAFSCMAMTMHTGEALALFHSHADSFVITNDFWYVSVLVNNGNESSQVSCRHS